MTDSVSTSKIVRALRRGWITIPAEFRRSLGLDKGTILQMTLSDGGLIVRPVQAQETSQTSPTDTEQTDTAPD